MKSTSDSSSPVNMPARSPGLSRTGPEVTFRLTFISFVIIFLIAYGLVFELPIIMVGLTRLGVVSPEFWAENWRYAFVGMIIFGAVVTPDGSGVTQIIVAAPMMVLYVIGYFIAKRMQKG